ncbi:hypothetical protein CfE428DRAFT_6682 [Chthoniobacter flavus Ellin428]|uniref:Uncharacterized protein n=1 Tax=Chthoniobacter flavus Ellin428 TaxID=497964 RepID=B4DCP1_9BACT|nr:hypothetical protein [Chthoniobacter flavus]EDY15789.1 hypothetical protein CfE428DRAFT_6682 [Chthoniobacter flavus Ellin428]TCO84211.1 hypothetical protein EV701_1375 [Chthoniobacter flavus]
MWRPLLREFEFDYADGYLFWDKSGRVARRLLQTFPDMLHKESAVDQKTFASRNGTEDFFYGVRVAHLRVFSGDAGAFRQKAAAFAQAIFEEFDVEVLTGFRFRLVLGWPCETYDEAQRLMHKLVPLESVEKLTTGLQGFDAQGIQVELKKAPWFITARFSVIEYPEQTPEIPGVPSLPVRNIPHVAASVQSDGTQPLKSKDLDVVALLDNLESGVAAELLQKLSPEIHADPS